MLTEGIGLIGLGSITDVHTTAYAKFGLPIVAGYDPAPAARERFAQRNPDVRLYGSLDKLLADPRVAVVWMSPRRTSARRRRHLRPSAEPTPSQCVLHLVSRRGQPQLWLSGALPAAARTASASSRPADRVSCAGRDVRWRNPGGCAGRRVAILGRG